MSDTGTIRPQLWERKFHEGYIEHKDSQRNGWNKYWLVLKQCQKLNLIIFRDEHASPESHVGLITLDSHTKFRVRDGDAKNGYKFDIYTKNSKKRFKSKMFHERETWRAYIVGLVKGTLPVDLDLPDVDKHMIQANIDYQKQGSSGSDRSRDSGVGNDLASLEGSCRFSISRSIDSDEYSTIDGGPTMHMKDYTWCPIYLVEKEPGKTPGRTKDIQEATGKISRIPTLVELRLKLMWKETHRFYRDPNYSGVPSWFVSGCSRDLAEKILTNARNFGTGNTLLRESTTYMSTGSYSITKRVDHPGGCEFHHYEVTRVAEGYKINVENAHQPMKCLSEVMDYFIQISGSTTKLLTDNNLQTQGMDTPDYQRMIPRIIPAVVESSLSSDPYEPTPDYEEPVPKPDPSQSRTFSAVTYEQESRNYQKSGVGRPVDTVEHLIEVIEGFEELAREYYSNPDLFRQAKQQQLERETAMNSIQHSHHPCNSMQKPYPVNTDVPYQHAPHQIRQDHADSVEHLIKVIEGFEELAHEYYSNPDLFRQAKQQQLERDTAMNSIQHSHHPWNHMQKPHLMNTDVPYQHAPHQLRQDKADTVEHLIEVIAGFEELAREYYSNPDLFRQAKHQQIERKTASSSIQDPPHPCNYMQGPHLNDPNVPYQPGQDQAVPPPPPPISSLERLKRKPTVSASETIPKAQPPPIANEIPDFEQELKDRLKKRGMSVDSTSAAVVTTLESIKQPPTVPSTPTSQRLQPTADISPQIVGQGQRWSPGQDQSQGQSNKPRKSGVDSNLHHSFASNRQKFDLPKPVITDQTFKPENGMIAASTVPPPPPPISGLERLQEKSTVSASETIPKAQPPPIANEILDFEQELKYRLKKRAMSLDSTSEAVITAFKSIRQPPTVPSSPISQRLQPTANISPQIVGQGQQWGPGQDQSQGQSNEPMESEVATNLHLSFASKSLPPPPPPISGLERLQEKSTVSAIETIPKAQPPPIANEILDFEQELKNRLRKRAMELDSTSEAVVTTSQRLQPTADISPHIIGQGQRWSPGQGQSQGQSNKPMESGVATNLHHLFASKRLEPAFLTKHKMMLNPQSEKFRNQIPSQSSYPRAENVDDWYEPIPAEEVFH